MFEAALDLINRYNRIIIHRHSKPDGDAIGSQIGLKHIILNSFCDKEVFVVGDPAGRYGFVEDSVMDDIPDGAYSGALAIILDCGSAALISDPRYKLAESTLRLDHHIFSERIADEEIVDPAFESCRSLVTALAMEAGLSVSQTAAAALFTGIVTDSGRFRYDTTGEATFERAAYLLRSGISIDRIYAKLYEEDFERIKLRAGFTLKIRFTGSNVAYIYTDIDEMRRLGADEFSISRGMVNVMADIKGVSVWVNFTETEAGVLCELRSNRLNINPIAVKYGGGGHKKASGATVRDRETAMLMLSDLDELVKQANGADVK